MKKLKQLIVMLAATFALAFPVLVAVPAHAALSDQVCKGAELSVDATCNPAGDTASGNKINDIIKLIVNLLSVIVGVIAVIMIIIGGLKYITSAGDSGNVSSAKNTILYAIIGLVVVALAQVIVRFVLKKVS
jgi:hypothetical protein